MRREGRNVRTGRGVRRSGRSGGELRRWGLLKSRGQFVVGEEDKHRFAVRCELVGVGREERGDHLLHLFGRERSAGADGGGSGQGEGQPFGQGVGGGGEGVGGAVEQLFEQALGVRVGEAGGDFVASGEAGDAVEGLTSVAGAEESDGSAG